MRRLLTKEFDIQKLPIAAQLKPFRLKTEINPESSIILAFTSCETLTILSWTNHYSKINNFKLLQGNTDSNNFPNACASLNVANTIIGALVVSFLSKRSANAIIAFSSLVMIL
ncbi:MAG: hypothetical protein ACTS6G_05775 [Candidatus Hodgkinia cicadicola]